MGDFFENSSFNPLPPILGGNYEESGGHPHAPAKGAMPLVESPIENNGES